MKRNWIHNVIMIIAIGCLTPAAALGAVPGIDQDAWGVAYRENEFSISLDFFFKVIDHDGISSDGSSHNVTATWPDGTQSQIGFYFTVDENTAYYSESLDLEGNFPPSGDYTFTVVDPEGNISTSVDNLQVDPLPLPDENSFTPSLKNPVEEFITVLFDNVWVNGQLFDDFDEYTSEEELYQEKWNDSYCQGQSGSGLESGRLVISQADLLGGNSCHLPFRNPENIESIQADITVRNASSGIPRGRIGANFYNNGAADIWAQINVTTERVYYGVGYENIIEYNGVRHNSWVSLASEDIMEVDPGQTVKASISWDGTRLRFTAGGNVVEYEPTGTINPAENDFKALGARISLSVPDTTPTFTWNPIERVNFYRLRIYNSNGGTIWRGDAGNQTSYTIPPGILLKDADYRYQLEARDAHRTLDVDHQSQAPAWWKPSVVFYPKEEDNAPYIDLDNVGAETWTDSLMGSYYNFWIKVHDGQGVPGNISSVSVTFPNGETLPLYYDEGNGSNTIKAGIYRNMAFLPFESGTYTYSVQDKDGHGVTLQETSTLNPIGFPALESLQPENNALINGTAVDFDWSDVEGAAFYQLRIYDQDFKEIHQFSTVESQYALPAGILAENSFYRYRIETRREFFDENVDNGSSIPTSFRSLTFRTGAVTGGTHSPSIALDGFGAAVSHYPHPGTGDPVYALEFELDVADLDGVPDNIDSLQMIYPDGVTTRTLKFYEADDESKGMYWLDEIHESIDTIQEGIYTFIVTDFDGNTAQAIDELQVNIMPISENLNPTPDSIVATATPLITWDPVSGAARYRVRINDGWDGEVLLSDFLTRTSYQVPAGALETGKTYSYRVEAFRETDEVDSYSKTATYWNERTHFTVEAPPAGNVPPDVPPVVGPADESVDPDGTVTLTTGIFADPDGDTHAQTQWLIRRADRPYHADANPAFEATVTDSGLTEYTVSGLDAGLKYVWKAAYTDTGSGQATWSPESSFKVGTSVANGDIRIPPGDVAADFRMVSLMHWPDDPTAESVLGDELGGTYDTRRFRIGAYDPLKDGGAYREYGEGLEMEPGRAYWIFARQGLDLTVNGVPVSPDHDIEVELQYNPESLDGWNMIGPPNNKTYDWGAVQVLAYDADGRIVFGPTEISGLDEPNLYIDTRLWRWTGGDYASDTLQMVPGEGYWVQTFQPNVYLRFRGGLVAQAPETPDQPFADLMRRGKDWMHGILPSPATAIASSGDTPPDPISGFSDEPITLSTGSSEKGGSCFISVTSR